MGLGQLLNRSGRQHTRAAGTNFLSILTDSSRGVGFPTQMYQGAMSIPGAWRAALLISDLLGSVPWDAYRTRAGQPVEKLDPTPPLLEQPSPPDTRMTTFSSWVLDLVWHGNAIGIWADRNADGWPTAVYPIPANHVQARYVTPPEFGYLPIGPIEYQIAGIPFSPAEILHVKGPCEPGALRGVGVLEAHLDGALSLASELGRQARSISQHGVPTGTLKSANPDLTEDEAKDLKAKWLAAQRDRTVAVLNATTEFQPLSWNPEEMELVEARKYSLTELALIFQLPLSFLGADQASRTYSNIEQEAINLLKFGVGGHLGRFEQTLSLAFPRGTQAKANLDAILRADTLARYRAHKIGLDSGFLTIPEVREMEDRPPLPPEIPSTKSNPGAGVMRP